VTQNRHFDEQLACNLIRSIGACHSQTEEAAAAAYQAMLAAAERGTIPRDAIDAA